MKRSKINTDGTVKTSSRRSRKSALANTSATNEAMAFVDEMMNESLTSGGGIHSVEIESEVSAVDYLDQLIAEDANTEVDESVDSPLSGSEQEMVTDLAVLNQELDQLQAELEKGPMSPEAVVDEMLTEVVEPVVLSRSEKMKAIMNRPEVKAKVSEKVKAHWGEHTHPMKGRKFSEEAKANMRLGHALKKGNLVAEVRAQLIAQLELSGVDVTKYL